MSTNQGTYADIYDKLCEGHVLEMDFSDAHEFQAFKIGLHKYRSAVADTLLALGESTEKTERELRFTWVAGMKYQLALTEKPATRKFEFTIVTK